MDRVKQFILPKNIVGVSDGNGSFLKILEVYGCMVESSPTDLILSFDADETTKALCEEIHDLNIKLRDSEKRDAEANAEIAQCLSELARQVAELWQ
jgi:hypothetical protein